MIATVPQVEVRGSSGVFCTTPCVTSKGQLGETLTFWRNGKVALILPTNLPLTPEGGVLGQKNSTIEVGEDFLFVWLGPDEGDGNSNPPGY